jgi:hypothetical protein
MLTQNIDHRATLIPIEAQVHQRPVDQIVRRLTVENPQWTEHERRGFLNFDRPECICGYELSGARLIVARALRSSFCE